MSFPRYPKYKASGVEWLGEVPEHWEVWKLRGLSRLESGHTPSRQHPEYWVESDCTIPWFTLADVSFLRDLRNWHVNDTSQRISELGMANSAARLLPAGTVILSRTASVGFSGITGIELAVSQDFAAWICGPRLSRFFLLFCLRAMSSEFRRLMMGSTHQTIYMPDIEAFRIPLPTSNEQTAIAAFLDHETAKIDALVAEQERLIELLKEKRQAVISHAVTKGLNPDAPMKDSGIEWLGEVPEHWEVMRMGNVFREVAELGTDSLPILSVSIHHGVSDKEMDDEEMDRKVTRSADRSKYKRVAKGDLVYNMMRAWQGGFGTVMVAGMVSPAYVVARPKGKLETAFTEHLLRTPQAIEQMRRNSRGITDFRLRLYWDEFKNISLALPTQEEAIAICAKIAEVVERFSAMSMACVDAIDLLKERRIALISAAVTGQIDVRNAVILEVA